MTGQATGLFVTGYWTLQPVAVASFAKIGSATGPAVASYEKKGPKSSHDWTLKPYFLAHRRFLLGKNVGNQGTGAVPSASL